MDLLDSILKLQEKYDDPDVVVKASDIKRPQSALDREMFEDANKRFNQADGGRIGFSDGSKTTMVRDGLDLLPKGSKVAPVDLANQLQVSRSLVDKVLKEKKYKNKFNVVRKLDSLSNQEFIDEYKNYQKSDKFITGEDKEFAQYLNDQGFKAEKGDRKFNEHNVALRRRRLNIDSVSPAAFRLSDDFVLKEAKRFKIDTKGLSLEEIRSKVLNKRQAENLRKKREADPELDERLKKEAIKRSKKQRKRLKSTEEGRAILREQRRREKQKRYLKEGLDPPANSAKEMLWKDTVKTAKEKSRFNIVSGYKKSMKKGDYYSDKIKIKDSITGKTFTFNTIENFINKNAGSFNIKNYEEVIRPYKQKQYINDKGLRNTLNEVLIPGWSSGDPRTAYTIQHEFGRKVNPFKVSLAFYDDNSKEYKIRSDFEKAWEKSKTSKTPLADKKLAFNTFKKDIDRLNIRSSPSMITRDRAFGKELDLKSILQKAKKEGAVFKRGTLKEAAEFDKQLINQIAVLGGKDCGRLKKYQGGRIGLQDGTPNVDVCFKNATNRINSGFKNATPAEARNYTKLLNTVKGSAVIGKNLLKIGIVPEALYVGADTLLRMGYGDTFKEAGLRAADFFIPSDLTQEADKLKVQRTLGDAAATNVGRVFDYRNQINKIKSLESQRESLEALNVPSEFGYTGDLTPQVKNIDMSLNQAKNDLQNKFMVSEAETVAADRALEEAYDASMAKGRFAKTLKSLRDIETVPDDPFLSDITSPEKTQMDLNLKMFSPMQTDFMKMTDTDIINRRRQLTNLGVKDIPSSRQLIADRDKEIADMKARSLLSFPREQVFGTQGTFFGQPLAGGGIAKLAGVDQGPPPESGPNSQGLQGLMKRVKNL